MTRVNTVSSCYEIDFPRRRFMRLLGERAMPLSLPDLTWIRYERLIVTIDWCLAFCQLVTRDCESVLRTSNVAKADRNAVMANQEWF